MKLPETDNAHHHYAFKKGYRLALEGKPQSHMPSQIRQDSELRDYFQMGWEQLQEELKNGEDCQQRTPWRQRVAWYLMMLLAGVGTASLMISEKNKAQQQQQLKIDQPDLVAEKPPGLVNAKPEITAESLSLSLDEVPAKSNQKETTSQPEQTATKPKQSLLTSNLGLLSTQQRQDLELTQQHLSQQQTASQIDLAPVVTSPIQIKRAQLGQVVRHKKLINPFDKTVPKYIRKVAFLTEIAHAQGQTIYHRWVYKSQEMATVALKIDSPLFRTWSTKQLTSAWEGSWHIEVLNEQKEIIFRYHFHYIQ
ncbi:MAG: hypothetical protein CO158_03095 [Piscirickettsiaceae bacterium CG_4_9_14_3_um_filter_43_564]|nr:MAG: hypothetical protein COW74_07285 [Piscirickettsiaceae bacterium CG18_big_fil_WC_8_21_14_2_50_44_103]PIW56675.1 MAG: hypothetical protein COW14_10525 [Piscirickettsiaceae bacterium CG12_big_fil_rev_8_21_14_0_65_44_934]PIX79456.1 MAG: hypothetical protein COZ36_05060 [Piscirickettsiaceae bacterium CG_4_10_14_3_um_filter_44_349]PIY76554.1 MAG: hypothetical protein COY84_05625 [Piscirickettsiaceae bacterium CG_4_10_14_0_8_um_filter_44_742]PIZ74124.1 MAG: hypothetical protein COY08_03725 [Pi